MTGELEASDGAADESPLERCPRCGEPMVLVTVRGPGDQRVSPCGCRL
ncbi:hypothetical protein [Natronobiforma cellulositropha]|nr:hypothetical protein [Natronobiforma cellulositropha]